MTEWREVPLGDIVELKRGYDLPKRDRAGGSVPIVSSSGISGTHDKAKAKGPGVVTGRYGTIGEVHWIKSDFWPLNTSLYVRDFKGNDPRFVYYLLKTFRFSTYSGKSAVPGVNRNDLHREVVRVPPRALQQRIAQCLGSLDDKIDLNRRTSRTLEAMAQALFRSWFVDFDPVVAKSDGREPFGMDAETATFFPDRLVDSELGPVPEGWKASRLGTEFEVTAGQSPPGRSYNNDGDGIIFFQGRADFGERFPAPRIYCTEPSRFADEDCTLVSVRAPVGDINRVHERCAIGRGLAGVVHRSGATSYTYYSMTALSHRFAVFEGGGTVFGSISQRQFKNLLVISPPDRLIERFEEIACRFDGLIRHRFDESVSLTETRDALLPELLSGRIRLLPNPAERSVA